MADTPSAPGELDPDELQVAVSSSQWAAVLSDCVTAENNSESCSLQALPLLGQDIVAPTVEDVMSRLVVSHDWMALRMEELLPHLPPDILRLMRSVTAVVVSAEIRPSSYSSGTGAIYIDPAYLWLSADEQATISIEVDYRSEFGDELNFVSLARYELNGDYAWQSVGLDEDVERSLQDLVFPISNVLFHELAHAADFFPPSQLAFVDRGMTVLEAAEALREERIAVRLANEAPLYSNELKLLAEVMYRGRQATEQELELTAAYVGAIFESDGANDDYAYSSIYEDVAMLFEEVMMRYHFGMDRVIAYTDRPADPDAGCGSYIVRWGMRNRVGEPTVSARAALVLFEILGDAEPYLAQLSSPESLPDGLGWCDSLPLFERGIAGAARQGSPVPPEDRRKGRIRQTGFGR